MNHPELFLVCLCISIAYTTSSIANYLRGHTITGLQVWITAIAITATVGTCLF